MEPIVGANDVTVNSLYAPAVPGKDARKWGWDVQGKCHGVDGRSFVVVRAPLPPFTILSPFWGRPRRLQLQLSDRGRQHGKSEQQHLLEAVVDRLGKTRKVSFYICFDDA